MNVVLFIMDKQGHWWLEHTHDNISIEEYEQLQLYIRGLIDNKRGLMPKK